MLSIATQMCLTKWHGMYFVGWLAKGTTCLYPITNHEPCVSAVLVGGLFVFDSGFWPFTFLEIMPVQERCLSGFRL